MHNDKELEALIETILVDFSEEELQDDKLMTTELKALLGISGIEAHELLVLARFKRRMNAELET